jgi:hypothetical protein
MSFHEYDNEIHASGILIWLAWALSQLIHINGVTCLQSHLRFSQITREAAGQIMPSSTYSYGRGLDAFHITDDRNLSKQIHTLTNLVHPIWPQDNRFVATVGMMDREVLHDFYEIKSEDDALSNVVHERMRPAFQLASLMLQASDSLFAKIRCAQLGLKRRIGWDSVANEAGHFRSTRKLDRNHVTSQADHNILRRCLSTPMGRIG